MQLIVSARSEYAVVTGPAEQCIVIFQADQTVVPLIATHDVASSPSDDHVVPAQACDDVVARMSVDEIVSSRTHDGRRDPATSRLRSHRLAEGPTNAVNDDATMSIDTDPLKTSRTSLFGIGTRL